MTDEEMRIAHAISSVVLDDLADCLEEGISTDSEYQPQDRPLRKIVDYMRNMAAFRRKSMEVENDTCC